ncbi:mitochondrial 54S ribosomal protein bL33m [Lipomyces oligophaga]|uniref:mitochondrial 54S ribosomal protein bL33m n=1 Tax=Lipomyces oligophaga TaxID=45792 RepID=UPI0034CDF270
MAKAKSKNTLVKLVSTASTGYMKSVYLPRQAQPLQLVRYDPKAKRHVLFEESRKRKGIPQIKPFGFGAKLQ